MGLISRVSSRTYRSHEMNRLLGSLPRRFTHYKTLKVPPTASKTEIHRAYLERAKELHPDVNTQTDSTENFLKVREAYKTLSSETAKAEYDKTIGTTQKPSVTTTSSSSQQEIKSTEREVRKKLEEWENEFYGETSNFGKARPKYKPKPRTSYNANLSDQDYTQWHEWASGFTSRKKSKFQAKQVIDDEDIVEGTLYYSDRFDAIEEHIRKENLKSQQRKKKRYKSQFQNEFKRFV